jgi:hypothetical protein
MFGVRPSGEHDHDETHRALSVLRRHLPARRARCGRMLRVPGPRAALHDVRGRSQRQLRLLRERELRDCVIGLVFWISGLLSRLDGCSAPILRAGNALRGLPQRPRSCWRGSRRVRMRHASHPGESLHHDLLLRRADGVPAVHRAMPHGLRRRVGHLYAGHAMRCRCWARGWRSRRRVAGLRSGRIDRVRRAWRVRFEPGVQLRRHWLWRVHVLERWRATRVCPWPVHRVHRARGMLLQPGLQRRRHGIRAVRLLRRRIRRVPDSERLREPAGAPPAHGYHQLPRGQWRDGVAALCLRARDLPDQLLRLGAAQGAVPLP